ncbi:MAG: hypothetical protein K9K63_12350 [Desulfotignum sp.]|jgi:hypothetical protein|nr:hypothetical protein [Desulfotignum sp.]MCF8089779.1 hypothetical protein [Desulfotignum sp.]MCF8138088.1 hypothetical protein [Desulfotignum sp.]
MTVFTEGNLKITFPSGVAAKKFDHSGHGLTHCMKAVDFIVELIDRYLFIEFKDPEHPDSRKKDRKKFVEQFLSGKIDEDFKYKYRDSFLYEWASGKTGKPVYYYVLVALDTLTEAELITRTDDLKRKLPYEGPSTGAWKKRIVAGCAVFNIATWNKNLSSYPVERVR